jgi:omega-amidase
LQETESSLINIALIQPSIYKSKLQSLYYFEKVLARFKCVNFDVICLPELWYTGIVNDFEYEFSKILELAKEKNSTIVTGAFFERINGDQYISCPIISRNGKLVGRQLKIHPFKSQSRKVKAGHQVEVFNFGAFKLGVVICYDSVFPEVSRALTLKGADILFFPSKIRTEGIRPWQIYLQARALENRIPVVAPNICGSMYGGKSTTIHLNYDKTNDIALPTASVLTSRPQLSVVTIDIKKYRPMRRRRFNDFKPHIYDLL